MSPGGRNAQWDGAYWDRVIERWSGDPVQRLWRAHSDAVNGRLLRAWLPARCGRVCKTDLFDEAVGRGLYPELASRSEHVLGVDVSHAAVRAAHERYPGLDARIADVRALPFADEAFDVTVSTSTLDHFDSHHELAAAVAELGRVMRRGGKLILTLDNRTNPVVALRTSFMFGPLHRLGLVPYFVGRTHGALGLSRVLRRTGFEIEHMAAIMHCPPQLGAWLAVAQGMGNDAAGEETHVARMLRFESLGSWPTRHLTAHFVAALACRR